MRLERILQDLDIREPPTRAFIQALLIHGSCKIFAQGPLMRDGLTRIATKSSVQDLYTRSREDLLERASPESLQDLLIRTCARSCKQDFIRIFTTIFSKGPLKRIWPRSPHSTDLQDCTMKLLQYCHTTFQRIHEI